MIVHESATHQVTVEFLLLQVPLTLDIPVKGPWPLSHDNISQVWPISKYSKTL